MLNVKTAARCTQIKFISANPMAPENSIQFDMPIPMPIAVAGGIKATAIATPLNSPKFRVATLNAPAAPEKIAIPIS